MQGENWTKTAEFCQKLYFAEFLGSREYRFLKQHLEQMMPAQVRAAYHLFKLFQEGITGVQGFLVLRFRNNYMYLSAISL